MKMMIYGSERYFLQDKARKIIEEKYEFAKDADPIVYDCERITFEWEQLFEELMTVSFFDEHKVIYCLNPATSSASAMSDSQFKTFKDIMDKLPDEVLFFLMLESPSYDQRLKIFKPFIQNKSIIKVSALSQSAFRNLVQEKLKEQGVSLSRSAFETMIDRLPPDVPSVIQEVSKLACYPDEITPEVIIKLISKPMSDSVFELSKAIMIKDIRSAWQVYHDLLVLKHDPTSLIPAIAWQYRIMFYILHYKQQKLSQSEIQQRLQEHDYVFNKAWQYALATNKDTVMRLLDQLATLDQSIKTGKTEKKIGFERFLLEAMR